jgi:hypothetical protein
MSGLESKTVSTVSGLNALRRPCASERMKKPLKRLFSVCHANTGLKPGANERFGVPPSGGALVVAHQNRLKAELRTGNQSSIVNRKS